MKQIKTEIDFELEQNFWILKVSEFWKEYVKKHSLFYMLGFFSMFLTSFGQVFFPLVIGQSLDFIQNGQISNLFLEIINLLQKIEFFFSSSPEKINTFTETEIWLHQLNYLVIIGFITQIVLFFGRVGWRRFLVTQGYLLQSKLRNSLWKQVSHWNQKKFNHSFPEGLSVGGHMNLNASDTNAARNMFGITLVSTLDVIFLFPLAILFMLNIDVFMTLLTLGLFGILPYFLHQLSIKESKYYDESQEFLSRFNDLCSQAISTIRPQKMMHLGPVWENKLNLSANDYRIKKIEVVKTSLNFIPLMGIGTLMSYLVLLIFGIQKVLKGELTVGQFIIMQSYSILLQDPLLELGFVISEIQKSKTSLQRILEICKIPLYRISNRFDKKLSYLSLESKVPMHLDIKNLYFRFDESKNLNEKKWILENFTLQVKPGEWIGITGPIGSGKTTLLGIISGLIDSTNNFKVNGKVILVNQRPFLFAQSIKSNLVLDSELDEEGQTSTHSIKNLEDKIWFYLHIVNMDEDIKKLPLQLETPLGEWGINLSGGQKQRLTICRALMSRPDILLLDDCLSAVDTITERKIVENLHHYFSHMTILWVAHRKSTLKYCSRIIELN
jgi:ATP-binding cassette subfamily B multidrug efflux pump